MKTVIWLLAITLAFGISFSAMASLSVANTCPENLISKPWQHMVLKGEDDGNDGGGEDKDSDDDDEGGKKSNDDDDDPPADTEDD